MFGRATIKLGISPHSSYWVFSCGQRTAPRNIYGVNASPPLYITKSFSPSKYSRAYAASHHLNSPGLLTESAYDAQYMKQA